MEHTVQELQQQNLQAHNSMIGLRGLVTGGYVTVDDDGVVAPVTDESQRLQILAVACTADTGT